MDLANIRKKISAGEYYLSEHAHRERQEEQITVDEIEQTLLRGVIIEEYPNDPRGESCLVGRLGKNRPIHVVCGFRNDRLLIVTVYVPKPPVWIDYKTRRKELKDRV